MSGSDFVSPATQDALRSWRSPLWEPTFASRDTKMPMWDRPDVFRTVNYQDTRNIIFSIPTIEFPAAQITPSGLFTLQEISRSSPVMYSDKELYDFNVQKIFSLFMQFDTLLESQIVSFTGIDLKVVQECLAVLWGSQIIEKPKEKWKFHDTHGTLWRLVRYSSGTRSYVQGMDSFYRAISVGGAENIIVPPGGSGARSTVKHNLFAAETMLRIAESCDNVIGVWGDLFGAENLFHEQNPNAEQRNSQADGIIVTKDGTIIILEIVGALTRQIGAVKTLIEKTASWVGVIAHSDLDINVLFVDTTFGQDATTILNSVDIGLRRESQRFAPDNFLRERALSHVGIVSGAWWFPDDGCISEAGTRLMGYDVTNNDYRCYDLPDKRFSNSERRKDVVLNTLMALHTPPWILSDFSERSFR